MTTFIALLRAINVSGTGKLPMKDLAALCVELGFGNVRTYIQSGNVTFASELTEGRIQAALEHALSQRLGQKADVMIRTAAELRAVFDANPFPGLPPAKVAVLFLHAPPLKNLDHVVGPAGEQVRTGRREIYIYYPEGMGRTKLKLPTLNGPATARNINTVSKLVAMTDS